LFLYKRGLQDVKMSKLRLPRFTLAAFFGEKRP